LITPDVPRSHQPNSFAPFRGESGRGDGERADKISCALARRVIKSTQRVVRCELVQRSPLLSIRYMIIMSYKP